ncbi:MAG: hypothetical protein VB135_02810 [Burkholderia sp.]
MRVSGRTLGKCDFLLVSPPKASGCTGSWLSSATSARRRPARRR